MKTCPDCGERVYNLGCVNCNEAAYIEEQERLNALDPPFIRCDAKHPQSHVQCQRKADHEGPHEAQEINCWIWKSTQVRPSAQS